MAVAARAPHAGQLLREWRARRNLSQLQLALGSAVSARHLSFIETGRARPSREMVLHLAERLEIPLRERNRLLLAAGFAPAYGERPLDSDEMRPVREALERFLACARALPGARARPALEPRARECRVAPLLEGIAPELLEPPANALRATLHPDGMAPRILNFDEWSAHLVHRLRREIALTGDASSSSCCRGARAIRAYATSRRRSTRPRRPRSCCRCTCGTRAAGSPSSAR